MRSIRLLALAALVTSSVSTLSAVETTERKVSVTGTAVTKVAPDIIVWSLTTTDIDPSLLAAKGQSDAKLKAIILLREALGVAEADVQTGHLQIAREYERDAQGNRREFRHFVVTRTVTYTQRALERFDEFLTKFVGAAEVELSFAFDTSKRVAIREETRIQAVLAAREKAAAMTKALGANIGKVLTIEEEGGASASWLSNGNNFSNFNRSVPGEEGAAPDVGNGTFAPGTIEVRISVKVSFEIE
jgi:uncharacterized protein YggE